MTVALLARILSQGLVEWALLALTLLTGFWRDGLFEGVKGRDPSEEVNRAVWVKDRESLT